MAEKRTRQNCQNDEASRAGLTQMIIKLRWIGLEDEAKQLEVQARRLPAEQRCGVSFGPFNTD